MKHCRLSTVGVFVSSLLIMSISLATERTAVNVSVDWSNTVAVSKTTPTIVACPFRPGAGASTAALQKAEFGLLRNLQLDYVRWHLINPARQVAEIEQPTEERTSWDFSRLDTDVVPFLKATQGHQPILNLTGIPYWMFKTGLPVPHSSIPDDPDLRYRYWERTKELVDPTGQQLGEYFARIAGWYTQGGFKDERGVYHHSGYHYDLPWWGVLNEIDVEFGGMTPKQYTARYDAIVSAVHAVSPKTKFVGLSLGLPSLHPEFFEYFLNPKNHRPGIPLDMLAYHFYAGGVGVGGSTERETLSEWQYTFFDQAAALLSTVRYIDTIRRRLSPETRVDVEEIGGLVANDLASFGHPEEARPVPSLYWNLNGALFAYLYVELARLAVDVATISGIYDLPHGLPGHFPTIMLMDPQTAALRAPIRVLELVKANFGPGDKLVSTVESTDAMGQLFPELSSSDVLVQAFVTRRGRKLIAVNKRLWAVNLDLSNVGRLERIEIVDQESGEGPPRVAKVSGNILRLPAFAVAVVTLAKGSPGSEVVSPRDHVK